MISGPRVAHPEHQTHIIGGVWLREMKLRTFSDEGKLGSEFRNTRYVYMAGSSLQALGTC